MSARIDPHAEIAVEMAIEDIAGAIGRLREKAGLLPRYRDLIRDHAADLNELTLIRTKEQAHALV